MNVFFSDLDNTLIYSYRHEIGPDKIAVETYRDMPFSFLSKETFRLLKEANEKVLFVPVTTRTIEQYQRIQLGIKTPPFALVCNGGVLLENGTENHEWYRESLALIEESQVQMDCAKRFLMGDKRRIFELRDIRGLFLFTKFEDAGGVCSELKQFLDMRLVDVFAGGKKLYVLPRKLNKGLAVRRLKQKLSAERTIAAGDSVFDIPMLQAADYAAAPVSLQDDMQDTEHTCFVPKERLLSEEALKRVLFICGEKD